MKKTTLPTLRTYRRLFQLFIAIAFILIPILNRSDYSYVYGNFLSFHLFEIPLADPLAVLQLTIKNFYLTLDNFIGALLPLTLAFCLGTVFCSWICPYGLLSELTHRLSKKILSRGYTGWAISWKGFPLKMGIFVLGFTAFFIFSTTPILNQLSTAAWYTRFFQYLFGQDVVSLCFLFLLALLIIEFIAQKRLWCRYICPQSILITLIKVVNRKRMRVAFAKEKCICKPGRERCVAACTLSLNPKTVHHVLEMECSNCGDCTVACKKMGQALSFEFPMAQGLGHRLAAFLPKPSMILKGVGVVAVISMAIFGLVQLFQSIEFTPSKSIIKSKLLSNKKISWKNGDCNYFELLADGTIIRVGGDWPINGFKGSTWEPVDKQGSFKVIPYPDQVDEYIIYRVGKSLKVGEQVTRETYKDGVKEQGSDKLLTISGYGDIKNNHVEEATTMDARVSLTRWAEETYVLNLTVYDPGGKKIKRIYTEGDAITTEGMLTSVHRWINSPEIIVSSGTAPKLPIHTSMKIIFHDGHTENAIFITDRFHDRSNETFEDLWF